MRKLLYFQKIGIDMDFSIGMIVTIHGLLYEYRDIQSRNRKVAMPP
jgi:hypothetical protein